MYGGTLHTSLDDERDGGSNLKRVIANLSNFLTHGGSYA
jgi:hypothetical protein